MDQQTVPSENDPDTHVPLTPVHTDGDEPDIAAERAPVAHSSTETSPSDQEEDTGLTGFLSVPADKVIETTEVAEPEAIETTGQIPALPGTPATTAESTTGLTTKLTTWYQTSKKWWQPLSLLLWFISFLLLALLMLWGYSWMIISCLVFASLGLIFAFADIANTLKLRQTNYAPPENPGH